MRERSRSRESVTKESERPRERRRSRENVFKEREFLKILPKTNMDKIVALTSLQTASGYFKEDNIIESIIGDKFAVFQEQCKRRNVETRVWITALIIAFIQKNFPDEKDSWELIVEKAQDWLGNTHAILCEAQCLFA